MTVAAMIFLTDQLAVDVIVVNLQTKSGSNWVSKSADVADATNDDAATVAHVDAHASSENSGLLSVSSHQPLGIVGR